MEIAFVNNKKITDKEFRAELYQLLKSLDKKEPSIDVQTKALNNLIDANLLLEETGKYDYTIDEQIALQQFHYLKKGYETEMDFNKDLRKYSITTEKLLENIRNNLLIKKFIETNFSNKNKLDEARLHGYYKRNLNHFRTSDEVRIHHLLISHKCSDSRKIVKTVQKKIKDGEDFHQLIAEFSNCPSVQNNGDLGYIQRGQFIPQLEKIVFNSKIGEIVGPIETEFGFHFVMVINKKSAGIPKYDDIKESLKEQLEKIAAEIELLNFIRDRRREATIRIYEDRLQDCLKE
ncbi:MAG: peptidylprolyl isomerase [Candidatus Cloacimonadota bacterium]|nr:peptidylprolyl isomerase [Candidatus Cloacimonadota bacterium]